MTTKNYPSHPGTSALLMFRYRHLLLLLVAVFCSLGNLQAQCNFNSSGAFPVVAEDIDDETAPFSFSQNLDIFSAGLGDVVEVTGPVSVRICFWGDMNATGETFAIRIAGINVGTVGDLGYTASQASPYCETFVVNSAGDIEDDLANLNGDINVTYNNFGTGWDNILALGDEFNAQVVSLSFTYDVPVTISNPGNACSDAAADLAFTVSPVNGTDPNDVTSFQIFPATPGFNSSTGTIDVSVANPGTYNVVYNYDVNGCEFEATQMVTVFAAPVANLKATTIECKQSDRSVDLALMFDGFNTSGGTFTLQEGGGTITGSSFSPPGNGEGCYLIRYEVGNPDGCENEPYRDEARLLIVAEPNPVLTLTGATSPLCSTTPVAVTIGRSSTGTQATYTIDGNTVTAGTAMLAPPAGVGSVNYEICLEETNSVFVCTGVPATAPCSAQQCTTFTIFNDGNDCGANAAFASECEPDPNDVEVCEVEVKNNLSLECSFFELNGPQLIEAEITNAPGIIQCSDAELSFDWQGSLPGLFGDIATSGPTIAELDPAAGAVCFIINFEICIPLPIVDDFCLDPIPLPDFVEEACDKTVGQFVFDALGTLIGGDGGSGIVVADTDGDGAFDIILDEYTFPANGTATIPNNVEGDGFITVRNVVSWPFMAQGVCGTVTDESINLLELLPIGAIPLVGVIIEDLLAAASCNVDLVFTDEETVKIPVINRSPPEFANCNQAGYTFSEDGICDTEANWSIPVAYDGCNGGILPYRGRTAGTDATNFNGAAPAVVVATESGLYQTAGPVPGSDLAPGTYMVTYTAYSCSAIESTCTFPVVVTTGDPVLACPAPIFVKSDADQCNAVVTGIGPIQGASCATVINYSVAFADGTMASTMDMYSVANRGTHNDASGLVFPVGESTVTYTMMVDINGDGDVDDTIDGTAETQTCDFTITVVDAQRPSAACIDVDVRLDNTGNVTVFAENPNNGIAFLNGGSTDNCTADLEILVAKPGGDFVEFLNYDCTETGYNLVTLRVTDDAGNVSTCLSQIYVEDFFEGITFDLDIPEICLENNNPAQLDFSNYLIITLPDGTTLSHDQVANNSYLGDAFGGFGISAFAPAPGTASMDPGSVSAEGVYTMGEGTGYVTVSYILAFPGTVVQNNNVALTGCLEIVHATFELRQPLEMESPECECIVQNDRIVNLGEVTGGLEPYTIQYGGVKLDVDSDGIADDVDGEYTYDVSTGVDIGDFVQDLGNLLVDYTQPTWSFTIVDARGCEIFRSGSCDNDDENGTPEILCENLGPVELTTEEFVCEAQYTWMHTLPTDNCDVILYTYTITNPDGSIAGPFDITALLNPDITNPLPDQFFGTYDFEHVSPTVKTSTVTYYAEDAVGNFSQCSFEVTVTDDDAPRFINCPEPAVIVDAPATWCSAFANYSLPLAVDNCSIPVVTQVDDTGLTSGDLYPVGITINTFEAVDPTGNTTRCDVKIIVNDFHTPPTFECPADVTMNTDAGDCGAVVTGIAPTDIEDNCLPNLTIVYRIDDAEGNELASGFDDASGNFFGLGTSTVRYSVQDMPLLLITEITHDLGNAVDGTLPVPAFTAGNPADGDYLEITNFNRAAMDVSCLMITRTHAGGVEEYAVPTFTILQPGGTLTIHFGDGTNSPTDDFFNVPGAANLAAGEPASYVVSLSRSIIDVAVMNGFDLTGTPAAAYWSGTIAPVNGAGIIRTTVWDTNTAADFAPGEACLPTTIGALNPGLAQPTPNGAATAIQAQPTVRVECDFTVTVSDREPAVCGLYGEAVDPQSGAIDVAYGECIETVYTVTDAFTVADVNLNIEGMAGDMGNLTFTLISPEGTEVVLATAVCAGTNEVEFTFDGDFGPGIEDGCGILNSAGQLVMPVGDIEIFNGEAAAGDWILQIGHNGQESTAPAAFTSSILFITPREAYPDYTTTLENDLGECGADYTWNHAILFDNCPGGTILWTIVDENGTILMSQGLPIFPENTEVTFFFPVGVSTVTYALTDANGNTSSCSFDVTVNDTEFPVITCPADVTIQLEGGDCEEAYTPTDYTATDNCAVVDIFGIPPFSQLLPIGENEIQFNVADAAGNISTCTYVVTILEYIPANPQMACIDQINIHLQADCEQEIIPAMVLAGREYYCFDNYVLTLLQRNDAGTFDTINPAVVGVDQIGEEIRYQVYDPRNDESCWGRIDVGFFEAPEFICPSDATVSCNAATGTDLLGVPVLQSCALAGATVSHADTLQRNNSCDDPRAILRRTWKVTDAFGNSASCVQTITIEAFDLATVRFPANLDGETNPAIYCADAANDPTLTDPENTGFPFVEDGSNIFTTNFCSASYLYTDEVFNICAGSYEILRTWKVRNTCQPVVPGVNPIEAVQIIRVLDFQNPQITCQDDLTISTSSIDCNGAYLIPEPVVETGCTNWQYTVSVSNGVLSQLPNGTYLVSGLDEGVYTIRYEVEDECGRYSECIFNLTVVDQVGPTAACEDGLNVSLDGNGQAIISAADVDGNSQDLCGNVQLEIRRLYELNPDNCQPTTPFYTDWGPSAGVNCCDLEELVTVELRVTDEDGNSSICWTQILIEDKLAPVCLAPEDVTITCQAYNAALPNDINDATEAQLDALFGTAGVTDNCSAAITQTITGEISNCGIGQLVRTFTATDGSGLTNRTACVQRINIVGVFDYQIVFPTDVSGTCAEIPDYEALVFNDLGCDLLTVTTQVDTLRTIDAGDECFKLRITYDAVNWCEFNSLGEPYLLPRDGRNGRNPETEPLYLNVIPGPLTSVTSDDVAFISRFADRVFNGSAPQSDRLVDDGNDINSNDNNGVIDARAYAQDDSRGAFRYVQYIKVYDEVPPVITVTEVAECFSGDGDNCTATVDLTFTATDECSMASVTAEIDVDFNPAIGFQPTRTLTAAELTIDVTGAYAIRLTNTPVGEHAVRIHANDGCGNFDTAILEFCVTPDKAPTPICIQTLTVTLMNDGTGSGIAAIWASDFVASPITDCFGNLIDDYSLYSDAEAGAAGFLPASGHLGITLTCDDLAASGGAGFPVRLYAFDAAGNTDYCQVFVEIQSGTADPCNPGETGNLAGIILDERQNAIEGVTVTLTGAADQPSEQVTAAEGTFSFTNLVMGADYTVSPTHYQDYMNGVRTSDIVGITRHILNTEALASPYSMLAADVDGNTSIDVGDIISIRRLILGQTDVFPGNMPSWLFVPATYEFPAQLNPWQEAFPTVANYNNFVGNVVNADFVGVKLGDINQSARPNALMAGVPRSLDGTLELEVTELNIHQGATYRVPVTSAALTEVDGYQFTLAFDRALLEVTDIEPGLVAAGNFGWNLADEGLITTSWNWNTNDLPTDWNGSEVLFTLIVQANTAGTLSEGLELGSRFTAAEAYERNTGNLRQPVLVFNEANLPAVANELLQNVPNPVRHQTIIGYTLAAAQPEVVVSIRDAAGRLVREFRREGTAGYNSLVVDNQMLGNAAGVYSYTVAAGDWVATKRMIVLK